MNSNTQNFIKMVLKAKNPHYYNIKNIQLSHHELRNEFVCENLVFYTKCIIYLMIKTPE